MATQQELDYAYMECAYAISGLSKANRKQVGAILVPKDSEIMIPGFNGTPCGFDNSCETEQEHCWVLEPNNKLISYRCTICNKVENGIAGGREFSGCVSTKQEVLHAESNAIAKVAQSTNSSRGATMYITMSPCFECAKLLIQAGIVRVVYKEVYKTDSQKGLDLLGETKIEIEKL